MSGLLRQSLRFGAVGLVNTTIGLIAIYALMFFFGSGPVLANAIGYTIGQIVSFALNRLWTFNSTQTVGHVLPKYLLAAVACYLMNVAAVITCMSYMSVNPYLAQLVGIGIYTVCMFFGCRWFVFVPSHVAHPPPLDATTMIHLLRCRPRMLRVTLWTALLVGVPLALAYQVLGLMDWNLSIPLIYRNSDDIWQFTLTKMLHETGWVLKNPYLGAPEIANWYNNAAAQTSALHSVIMLAMSPFIQDPIRLQQVYYLTNFPLICLTSFIACRLLGVARLPAFSVGLLFAFTTFRIDEMLYAFLSNYFMVPLALVAVIWILSGKFAALAERLEGTLGRRYAVVHLIGTKEFILGLFFVALMAASDGYYAFFTLLLLGFSTFIRILVGDWRRPLALLPAFVYIFTLLVTSLSLMQPLNNYKKSHWDEFYPNGVEDPVLVKHAFEAEIYSATLKMIVAPIQQHRIESLARLGKWMVETSDEARKYKNGRCLVPLGTLGSLIFGVAFVLLAVPGLRKCITASTFHRDAPTAEYLTLLDSLLALTLFIFLCSTLGGIGTLVALIFPTIRGYDRFPLFMLFVLYLGAAWFVTQRMQNREIKRSFTWGGIILIVTALALLDQIPSNSFKGSELSKSQFLAERNFVKKVEAGLPLNAMIYQYPYSQYLRPNKYYGWGSFSHIRLYLHSRQLRWSNGGAKNSAADDWNFRISQLPFSKLIAEVEGMGFSGVVIDRTVVNPDEYQSIKNVLIEYTSGAPIEDADSSLAFFRLRDPSYRLVYDASYRDTEKLIINDRSRTLTSTLPRLVNQLALKNLLEKHNDKSFLVIERSAHPEVFFTSTELDRGNGTKPISSLSEMRGKLECTLATTGMGSNIFITLENNSSFDWNLNQGDYPLRIGAHLRHLDGTLLRWDDGWRLSTEIPGNVSHSEALLIPSGTMKQLQFPLSQLNLKGFIDGQQDLIADFRMVQDGNAWFEHLGCNVVLKD